MALPVRLRRRRLWSSRALFLIMLERHALKLGAEARLGRLIVRCRFVSIAGIHLEAHDAIQVSELVLQDAVVAHVIL